MTPEEAETIYYKACNESFNRNAANYKPVNQREGILAGFQAIIDAVTREIDMDYAKRMLLKMEYDAAVGK